MTRASLAAALIVAAAAVALGGCFKGFDPDPRTTKELRLWETRIDRSKHELRHTQYALRKYGEKIVFAVRGDASRTFGFTGRRDDAMDEISYDLADRDGVGMELRCKVETIAVHPRGATYAQRDANDTRCDGKLAWNQPASIQLRVMVCDQKDANEKPTPGLFWHAGPIRLAPGPGVEEVVEQCGGDEEGENAGVYDVGYREIAH